MNKIKMSPAVVEVLKLLADGKIAERKTIGGYTHVWFIDGRNTLDNGKSITRAINSLIKRGLVWTHFPSNRGDAGINAEGKAVLRDLGVSFNEGRISA